jgi:hypothetical protein
MTTATPATSTSDGFASSMYRPRCLRRDAVEALLNNPAVQAEMVADGVDTSSAQIDFLDEPRR